MGFTLLGPISGTEKIGRVSGLAFLCALPLEGFQDGGFQVCLPVVFARGVVGTKDFGFVLLLSLPVSVQAGSWDGDSQISFLQRSAEVNPH